MLAVNYLDTCWSWADNRVLNGLTVLEKDVLSLSQPLCKVVPPLVSCFYFPVSGDQPEAEGRGQSSVPPEDHLPGQRRGSWAHPRSDSEAFRPILQALQRPDRFPLPGHVKSCLLTLQ